MAVVRGACKLGAMEPATTAAVEQHWIPLGAGGHCVRFDGRVFEAIAAARGRLRYAAFDAAPDAAIEAPAR